MKVAWQNLVDAEITTRDGALTMLRELEASLLENQPTCPTELGDLKMLRSAITVLERDERLPPGIMLNPLGTVQTSDAEATQQAALSIECPAAPPPPSNQEPSLRLIA